MKKLATLTFLLSFALPLYAGGAKPVASVLSQAEEINLSRMVSYALENNRVPKDAKDNAHGALLATLGNTETSFADRKYQRVNYRLDVYGVERKGRLIPQRVLLSAVTRQKPVRGVYGDVESSRFLFNSGAKLIRGVLAAPVAEIPKDFTCISPRGYGPRVNAFNLNSLLRDAVRSGTVNILLKISAKYPRL